MKSAVRQAAKVKNELCGGRQLFLEFHLIEAFFSCTFLLTKHLMDWMDMQAFASSSPTECLYPQGYEISLCIWPSSPEAAAVLHPGINGWSSPTLNTEANQGGNGSIFTVFDMTQPRDRTIHLPVSGGNTLPPGHWARKDGMCQITDEYFRTNLDILPPPSGISFVGQFGFGGDQTMVAWP